MPPMCPAQTPLGSFHDNNNSNVPRYTKLTFPTYDGSTNPLIWLQCCEHFFWHQRTHPEERVSLAGFHLLDEALLWYSQFDSAHLDHDWELFKESCLLRFGAPACSNPLGDLVNLKQTGSIEEYQKQFQECLARTSLFVRPSQHVHLFIAGLVEALRLEVELQGPSSLD
ncbi:uncharacterized protein [Aristolochia californica]|uniref:uncharacterized protein n=1 Tax=Aristolochia californica TaxID=171875 RepID=UPI0035DE6815